MIDPKLAALQTQLPVLPGYSFQIDKFRSNERKSHAFDYCNGVAVFKGEAPGIGGAPLPGQEQNKIHTSLDVYPHSNLMGENIPAWVAFDRKVLRFYAYFQEAVHERREEKYRIRRHADAMDSVNIYFYLEDDSVHVSEPKTPNSGIPQGTLIRRHRIPKATSEISQHYTVSDFNVKKEVTFYSRTFKIVGCDDFTRGFLASVGIIAPENGEFPADPYETQRNEMLSRMKATRPSIPNFSLKKFLENDRRVLRFYCVWDDSNSVFGDLRHMVVHYYLSDDTIEIRESIPANSGRESNTLFLRRCKLPKRPHAARVNGRSVKDNPEDYFTERDFMIGGVLHLYGRPFVICDCDEFTKTFYRENYGVEVFDPVRIDMYDEDPNALPFFEAQAAAVGAAAGNAGEPSAPLIGNEPPAKKDFKKLVLYDGVKLRFLARLDSNKQVDRDRKFVITLHLADDTISVFEPRARNSGILGGKFLEQRRIKKPNSAHFYDSKDFFVGGELVFYQHHFVITGADEYAVKFMDLNPQIFPGHKRSMN
ncbi:hypothetical protein HK105_206897 [Polyrhizophydium stewartii]|uniref:DM10 domain-containing protein n=1 Tax=Polyrhizophydium stewartii TaxID=2732419 RepID=A0ABR4N254_9FUNG|nr:EF-hand domain-containing member C2 [Polyrhizophydium stewartii]